MNKQINNMDKILISWTNDLSVGFAAIDEQHKKLVGMLNELYTAALELRGQKAILSILASMGAYTQEHFTYEEKQMDRCGYSDGKRHKAEHIAFIEYVEKTMKRLEMNDFVSSIELITYLRDWLTNHILTVDKQYGACLASCDAAAGHCE